MNRLVLIGNGFDLAHGLPTSYKDFINWYWECKLHEFIGNTDRVVEDLLCKLTSQLQPWSTSIFTDSKLVHAKGINVLKHMQSDPYGYRVDLYSLFEKIMHSVETKGWVDIENEYYDLLKNYVLNSVAIQYIESLNEQLQFLQCKLVEYLKSIEISDNLLNIDIRRKIYAPIKMSDISIESEMTLINHLSSEMTQMESNWNYKLSQYGNCYSYGNVSDYKKKFFGNIVLNDEIPDELLLPNNIMLINFNYTHTADLYCKKGNIFSVNQIHGDSNNPKSVIFGYGDELDESYKTIVNQNENKFLGNIKSIKYLEADNYRKMLSFVESEPYQILIMGHSCGNSDRTLLNTLFEHKNCVSIKPYYYQIDKEHDNYIELVQNISRNFTDMKLMRDRVVNKTYCEPLTRNN